MKTILKIHFVILLPYTLYASNISSFIESGKNVNIKSCDKYNWCKIQDSVYYIKKRSIGTYNSNQIQYKTKELTALYEKQGKSFQTLSNYLISQKHGYKKNMTGMQHIIKPHKDPNIIKQSINNINNYFIALGLNTFSMNVRQNDTVGKTNLAHTMDTSGKGFNIKVGKYFYNRYAASLNYEKTNLSDVNIYSLYASLNYIFKLPLDPYIGISAGQSFMDWKIDPRTNAKTSNHDLKTKLFGIQTGASYKLNNNFSTYSQFSFRKYNFKTKVISSQNISYIKHKKKTSFELGIKYNF